MATGNGLMTSWNCPNYAGELITSAKMETPFLSMIGGIHNGGATTNNAKFIIGQDYDMPVSSQPAISEKASLTAPDPTYITRNGQKFNVCQIFHETVGTSYVQQSNTGKMSGLALFGQNPNPVNELDWQTAIRLKKIARDVEYTFLQGKYAEATTVDTANKTRGILELCATGTTVAAAGADLSIDLLKTLYREINDAGAKKDNMVLFCNSYQKQAITSLYEKQIGYNKPAARNIGGMSITTLENDFFSMGIVYDPFMPADTILIADVAHIRPVFQPVPGKGILFREELAKTGASTSYQIFGQIGLDHGYAFMHGTITGLKTE